MKILALEKELSNVSNDFTPHLKTEAEQVWRLMKNDVLREIYFTQETNEAILILECESADAAREYLNALPLVNNGLITFEILTLKPYTGFERLFL